jgi:hypothetical protein
MNNIRALIMTTLLVLPHVAYAHITTATMGVSVTVNNPVEGYHQKSVTHSAMLAGNYDVTANHMRIGGATPLQTPQGHFGYPDADISTRK